MATSLPQDILLVALSARDAVHLGLPQDQAPLDMLSAIRSIDGAGDAGPLELSMFCAELDAVMMELSQEEPEVVHTGSTAAMDVGDDIGLREGVVDSLASIAEALGEGENAAPVSDSALDKEDPAGTSETQPNIQEWSLRTSKNWRDMVGSLSTLSDATCRRRNVLLSRARSGEGGFIPGC